MPSPLPIAALTPEIIVLVGACVVLLLGQSERQRAAAPWVALLALVGGIFAAWTDSFGRGGAGLAVGSGLSFGPLAAFVRLAALELGIVLVLVNWAQSREQERGEFLALMLIAIVGLLLVAPADNLFILFLALELVSIPGYILVVLGRTDVRGAEGGTKYFYLGAMSAALMAYGFALIYGVAGTASLTGAAGGIRAALQSDDFFRYGLAIAGLLLSLAGVLFKIAAVPLHFYLADVYEGAAATVAGFLGFVPKLGGLLAIFKLVHVTGLWDGGQAGTYWVLWIIAAASMTIGNVLALRQTNIKRMLAYSGIAHAGYMLVGVVTGPDAGQALGPEGVGIHGDGVAAALFYMVIYGIANLGAFAVLGLLRAREGECATLRDVAGLLRREPAAALLLALAMFTLMGLPPTPGFWGKFNLFGSAVALSRLMGDTSLIVLVVIGVLNSALAAAYYLRVVAAVLLYDNERPASALPREAHSVGALLCGFLLLIFSVYPGGLMMQGRHATWDLRRIMQTESLEDLDETVLRAGHSDERSDKRHSEERSDEESGRGIEPAFSRTQVDSSLRSE